MEGKATWPGTAAETEVLYRGFSRQFGKQFKMDLEMVSLEDKDLFGFLNAVSDMKVCYILIYMM